MKIDLAPHAHAHAAASTRTRRFHTHTPPLRCTFAVIPGPRPAVCRSLPLCHLLLPLLVRQLRDVLCQHRALLLDARRDRRGQHNMRHNNARPYAGGPLAIRARDVALHMDTLRYPAPLPQVPPLITTMAINLPLFKTTKLRALYAAAPAPGLAHRSEAAITSLTRGHAPEHRGLRSTLLRRGALRVQRR